jgi:4-amino-4-deoxy-L-arabinose transferase-like glycosyltransferase
MQKYHKILIFSFFSIIIIYGLFLRVYKIDQQSYWIDEGYTLNAVLSTLEKGYPILDSDKIYGPHYLLNNYLISGAVKLGGFNPTATRLPAVIFGMGAILMIYLLGRQYFNKQVGTWAAVLTTLSYWEIAWSRQARMYIELQFFFLLSLYLFNSLLNKFSYKKLVLLILTTLAAILSHYFGYLLIGIYALILLINLFNTKKEELQKIIQDKRKLIVVALSGLGIIALLVKLFLDFFRKASTNNFFIGHNYQNFLIDYLPLVIVMALAGAVIIVLKEKNIKTKIGLIVAYLLPYLIITFSADTLHFRYLFFILPILFILTAYVINIVSKKFKYSWLLGLGILILVITTSNYLQANTFVLKPIAYYYLEPHTPQPDFKSAYQTIKDYGWTDDKIILSAFTQLDKVYLGRSDYWLAIGLDGRKLDKSKLSEREYYNNAITIKDVEQLKELTETKTGYIIVDNMTGIRLDREINDLINQQKLIFYNKAGQQDPIWVFAF